LREFSAAERKEAPSLVDRGADAVETLLTTPARNQFNE
jgi:hypothetical protein